MTGDLRQVAQAVAGIDLQDTLVTMIFTLFDENSQSHTHHHTHSRTHARTRTHAHAHTHTHTHAHTHTVDGSLSHKEFIRAVRVCVRVCVCACVL